MSGVPLDLDDIQGNIAPGFRSDFQDFLFVRFPSAEAGRAWLSQLYPEVASASDITAYAQLRRILRRNTAGATRPERPSDQVARVVRTTWVNVALTAAGLETVMGESAFNAHPFPAAFAEGMARRSAQIGDRQEEVAAWDVRDRAAPDSPQTRQVAHAVLIVGTDTAADLDVERARQVQRAASLGLHLFKRYRGNTLGRGREHFGFRDGLSQPEPDPETLQDGWTADAENGIVEPGEIIVGLRDEYGDEHTVGPDWVKNGSYLVFRRLRQDVAEFRRTLKRQAPVLAATIPKVTEDFLAARLVGRWPSGATLGVLEAGQVPPGSDPFPMDARGEFPKGAPTADDVKIESADYAEDPRGDRCPVFAHVRRAHPRSSPELEPNRHRILRRGIPYGPPLPNGATDHADRGLLFVAYQADISRGFETIQGQWFNSPNTSEESPKIGVTNGWDPIAGVANYPEVAATQPRRLYLHVPGTDSTMTPIDVGRLVEVTAGGYFFAPPISALKILASGGQTSRPAPVEEHA